MDAIAIERRQFCSYLSLKRVKKARVEAFREDLKPWFSFSYPYNASKAPDSLHSIILSRKEATAAIPDGSMTTAARIAAIKKAGLAIMSVGDLKTWDADLAEEAIVSQVALLAAGLAAPPLVPQIVAPPMSRLGQHLQKLRDIRKLRSLQ
ncbi:MAG: hypothetical protein ABIP20_03055 [Chthoniobacteraceae bacterium]